MACAFGTNAIAGIGLPPRAFPVGDFRPSTSSVAGQPNLEAMRMSMATRSSVLLPRRNRRAASRLPKAWGRSSARPAAESRMVTGRSLGGGDGPLEAEPGVDVVFRLEARFEGTQGRDACHRQVGQGQAAEQDDALGPGRGDQAQPGDGLRRHAFAGLLEDGATGRVGVGLDRRLLVAAIASQAQAAALFEPGRCQEPKRVIAIGEDGSHGILDTLDARLQAADNDDGAERGVIVHPQHSRPEPARRRSVERLPQGGIAALERRPGILVHLPQHVPSRDHEHVAASGACHFRADDAGNRVATGAGISPCAPSWALRVGFSR